jgi:hypothetical protein
VVTRLLKRRSTGWLSRYRTVRKLYRNHCGESGARALRLLRSWLSSAQREQFEARHHFDVIGCDTGKRYRIHWGRTSNVYEIDEAGEPKRGWCFAPIGNLSEGDVMLAQKIALETSEHKALALANRFLPRVSPLAGR